VREAKEILFLEQILRQAAPDTSFAKGGLRAPAKKAPLAKGLATRKR